MKRKVINKYKTFIFDCDGVVLNSNKVKSESFYKLALPYGKKIAEEFLKYHKKNGGISRYKKLDYLIKKIGFENKKGSLLKDKLLIKYAKLTNKALESCEIPVRLEELRLKTPNADWLIVSGGDNEQVNSILKFKNISNFFNRGIFGSPESKYQIITSQINKNHINYPVLYLGDSKLDYEVAKNFNMDFIFISKWTEFEGWENYFKNKNVIMISSLDDLIDS